MPTLSTRQPANVAVPLTAATGFAVHPIVVPAVPVPGVTVSVTLLVSVVALPNASRIATTGCVLKAMPGFVADRRGREHELRSRAPAVMLNVFDCADVRPAAEAVIR